MRCAPSLLLACLLAFLTGCGGSSTSEGGAGAGLVQVRQIIFDAFKLGNRPKDLIIGKWQGRDPGLGKGTLEFERNGRLTIAIEPIRLQGKYQFLTDNEIEVEVSLGGLKPAMKERMKVAVTRTELVTTDSRGKVERFQRLP